MGLIVFIKVINSEKEKYGAESAVFTYCNQFGKKQEGLVFTYEERLVRIENCGANEVLVASFTQEFSNLSPNEFLSTLLKNHNIRAFVCGKDFKFGKKALGTVEFLSYFCNKNKIPLTVCDFTLNENGEKISTSTIKELLSNGDINGVNKLLGDDYFITGKVVEGRKVGRTLGFPTANLTFEKDKFLPKPGVYLTEVCLGGKKYGAITNLGSAPTFNVDKNLIECHIHGFNGNLYGENLTVYFKKYLRGIKKFESKELLISQLQSDLKEIK